MPFLEFALRITGQYKVDLNHAEKFPVFPIWFAFVLPTANQIKNFYLDKKDILGSFEPGDYLGIIPVRKIKDNFDAIQQMGEQPEGALLYGMTVDQFRPEKSDAENLRGRNRNLLKDILTRYSGNKFWIDTLPSSNDLWRTYFGPRYQTVLKNKKAYDPKGIFSPLPHLFEP